MSKSIELVDEGYRKRVSINGESFYLYVSATALVVTVPRENDSAMQGTREIVETLASVVTKLRETL